MANRMAMDELQSFVRSNNGKFEQSPETKKVLSIMQKNTDVPINIEAAPSPMLLGGQPSWGSGAGAFEPDTGRAFVDPFAHPTVAAHEAGHQAFMSKLGKQHSYDPAYQKRINDQLNNSKNFTTEMVDKGATMRFGYEAVDKPKLIEEANAQGVAQAAMDKAGIPVNTSGWEDMYAYPEAHSFGKPLSNSTPMYRDSLNKPGLATLNSSEAKEFNAISRGASPAVRRQFDLGYQRIK